MKENKQLFYWSVLLSILSLLIATAIEAMLPVKRYVIEILPFLSGHGEFVKDICLGIFTGGIISIATSYIQYKSSLQNMVNNLIIAYGVRYAKAAKIQREEMDYAQLLELIDGFKEVQVYLEEFGKGFSPFIKRSKKNKKYMEISSVAFDLYKPLIMVESAGTSTEVEKYKKMYIDSAVKNCNVQLRQKHREASELNKWIEEKLGYKI